MNQIPPSVRVAADPDSDQFHAFATALHARLAAARAERAGTPRSPDGGSPQSPADFEGCSRLDKEIIRLVAHNTLVNHRNTQLVLEAVGQLARILPGSCNILDALENERLRHRASLRDFREEAACRWDTDPGSPEGSGRRRGSSSPWQRSRPFSPIAFPHPGRENPG